MPHDYDRSYSEHLYRSRIIYLSGDIGTAAADSVISRLLVLDSLDPQAEIKLYISSFGGAVYPGLAIYDAMQLIEAPVTTFCVGPAFSMAAVLLAAGEPGRRVATPNSRIMLHQPSSGFAGKSSDVKIAAQNLLMLEQTFVDLLVRHTNRSAGELSRYIERDFWMTPTEAKGFGIIDEVTQPNAEKLLRIAEHSERDVSIEISGITDTRTVTD